MEKKNRYAKSSKISEAKLRHLVHLLSLDLTAFHIANLTGFNRNTVNRYLGAIRVAWQSFMKSNLHSVELVDEYYFGPNEFAAKVDAMLDQKRLRLPSSTVADCANTSLQKIILGRVEPNTTINSDGRPGYDGLVDIGYKKHFRVHHGDNEFARGDRHINGIESLWSIARKRLAKFNRLRKEDFLLPLQETEFRFNIESRIYTKLSSKSF